MGQDIGIKEVRTLTQTIKDEYGYDFRDYALSSFKRRVERILDIYRGNISQLIRKIREDKQFFEEILDRLTVGTSEMFRDPEFWRFLRKKILPGLDVHGKIKIWHPGCSTGEEVYTMGILLREEGLYNKSEIIATDINEISIEKAQKGQYTKRNWELFEKNYQEAGGKNNFDKYFTSQNGTMEMNQELLSNVSFRKHDLVNGFPFSKFDLIICRNVFIYFNVDLQSKVLDLFHQSLFKNGYLALGVKESLIRCNVANKFKNHNRRYKVYQKVKE